MSSGQRIGTLCPPSRSCASSEAYPPFGAGCSGCEWSIALLFCSLDARNGIRPTYLVGLKADLVAVVEAEKSELEQKLVAAERRLAAEAQKAAKAEEGRARLAADIAAQKAAEDKSAALEKKLAEAQRRAEEAETGLAAALRNKDAGLEKKLSEAEKRAEKAEEQRARLAEDLKARKKEEKKEAALAAEKSALEKKLAEAQRRAARAETAKQDEAGAPPVRIVAAPEAAGKGRLRRILDAAGLQPKGERALSCAAGGVLGSAEETAMGRNSFGGKVNEWLARMQSRCDGDFAHAETSVQSQDGVAVQKAEIACIGGGQDAAAALLFIGADGKFSAVMHETAPEVTDAAIARRDAVAQAAHAR